MTDPPTPGRPITADEIAVIRAALQRAADIPKAEALLPKLEGLLVVGGCDCGCVSVDFEVIGQAGSFKPIADAVGKTSDGHTVGVLIWGTVDRVTALEIYDFKVDGRNCKLPLPDSIAPVPGPYDW